MRWLRGREDATVSHQAFWGPAPSTLSETYLLFRITRHIRTTKNIKKHNSPLYAIFSHKRNIKFCHLSWFLEVGEETEHRPEREILYETIDLMWAKVWSESHLLSSFGLSLSQKTHQELNFIHQKIIIMFTKTLLDCILVLKNKDDIKNWRSRGNLCTKIF